MEQRTGIDPSLIARRAMELGAAQILNELSEAIELVSALQPSVIAEIGCLTGGTLYAWRQVCERVYGITLLENYKYSSGRHQCLESHGAVMRYGDSHDPESRRWLESELSGSPVDVLVIDADHVYTAVKQDLVDYGPLVRPGGLILLHDVLYRYPDFPDEEFQVWRLWEQLQHCCDTSVIGTRAGWGVIRVRQGDDFGSMELA